MDIIRELPFYLLVLEEKLSIPLEVISVLYVYICICTYVFFLLLIYILLLFSCNYVIHMQATGSVKYLMVDMKLLLLMGKVFFLL